MYSLTHHVCKGCMTMPQECQPTGKAVLLYPCPLRWLSQARPGRQREHPATSICLAVFRPLQTFHGRWGKPHRSLPTPGYSSSQWLGYGSLKKKGIHAQPSRNSRSSQGLHRLSGILCHNTIRLSYQCLKEPVWTAYSPSHYKYWLPKQATLHVRLTCLRK